MRKSSLPRSAGYSGSDSDWRTRNDGEAGPLETALISEFFTTFGARTLASPLLGVGRRVDGSVAQVSASFRAHLAWHRSARFTSMPPI